MRVVRVFTIAYLGFCLIFGSLFAQKKTGESTGKKTFVGTVTDTICGNKHMMKNMTDAECARKCVEHGGDYALAVGSKIYTLRGNKDEIGKLAGQHVKVTGTAAADTITVASIQPVGTKK
jgi:hypothetical protein